MFSVGILSLFFMMSCGQTREFQNNRYEKIDGEWYLVSEGDQKFPIVKNAVTLKYSDGVEASKIKDFEQKNSLVLLRKSSAGWYDYELPDGADVFKVVDELSGSDEVAEVEIPTTGTYNTGSYN